jgi:carbon starvation protein CstA
MVCLYPTIKGTSLRGNPAAICSNQVQLEAPQCCAAKANFSPQRVMSASSAASEKHTEVTQIYHFGKQVCGQGVHALQCTVPAAFGCTALRAGHRLDRCSISDLLKSSEHTEAEVHYSPNELSKGLLATIEPTILAIIRLKSPPQCTGIGNVW